MDNVVQNINMEDIVPSKFQPNNEEKNKIEELAQLIKSFGIIDPIVVRPKNGKYEIVLGTEKYQAAVIAGLNRIPAIIKEIDDETFSKYLNVDNNKTIHEKKPQKELKQINDEINNLTIPLESQDNISSQKWQRTEFNENSDIVNLAELSKIKLEYERDDFKMNNEQLNNMMMNNNLGPSQPVMNQPTQPQGGPTFGGRFFPSLEDEPTNMNMMGNSAPQAPVSEIPNMNNNLGMNNNLIDLTDLSMDKEPAVSPIPEINSNPMGSMAMPQTNFGISPQGPAMQPTAAPAMDSIISLESLQNNNPAVQPTPEPTSLETLNADFGAPSFSTMQQPQFDMSQNIAPAMSQPIAEMNQPVNDFQIPQTDFGMNNPTMGPQSAMPGMGPVMNPNPEVASMATLNEDFGAPSTFASPVSTPEVSTTKDVTPVTNTIKSLISNLEAFGYKININEEELLTSTKLTIEVEK